MDREVFEHLSLDEQLSEVQRVLRDGYHDHLSRAVATARNRLQMLGSECVCRTCGDVASAHDITGSCRVCNRQRCWS